MQGFVRVGGHFVAAFDAIERRILAAAVSDTAELLGVRLSDLPPVPQGGSTAPESAGLADPFATLGWGADAPEVPQDPALARLLPSASHDDEALAAEFRRLTEAELRATKVENLRLVWSALRGPAGTLLVPAAGAPRWAAALTDVRLVLAARLDIETDDDAERVYAAAADDDADDVAVWPGEGPEDLDDLDQLDDLDDLEDLDGFDEPDEGDDEAGELHKALATLYAALTWLQDSLVTAMLDDPAPGDAGRL